MLDTKSLMQVAACCTMFSKSAMDPLCYSHIDLTTASTHVDDVVLRTMIHRAGNKLRLQLLLVMMVLTISTLFLQALVLLHYYLLILNSLGMFFFITKMFSDISVFNMNLLTCLHIYNIESMDISSICSVLSASPNLTDLKIAQLRHLLKSLPVLDLLTRKCHLVEHLFLETSFGGKRFPLKVLSFCYTDDITYSTIEAFLANCPKLTCLTLKGLNLDDAMAQILVKYVNLSSTSGIHGSFLRDLGHNCKDSPLETLILRDCSLEEREVVEFLNSLI
ncbi:unnamed protein product, partial [Brassica oleracea]